MAARGLLRLSTRLQKATTSAVKFVNLGVHSRQYSFNAISSSGEASRNTCRVCADSPTKRQLHSLCQVQDNCRKWTPNDLLHTQKRYRRLQTSEIIDFDEDKEDSEEVGAFQNYDLSEVTKDKLRDMGIKHLFPVQYTTFKHTIEGNDVIVQARTGTGKTLSFALPIVEKLLKMPSRLKVRKRNPVVLVLAPTRELANQVKNEFCKLSHDVVVRCAYGGVNIYPQIEEIQNGVDVVVGTPGRVKDLMDRRVLKLSDLEHVILDEVDQMLDMGFSEDVNEIVRDCYRKGSTKPQTMLYSATVPSWVLQTAKQYLSDDYKLINLVGKQNEQTATTIKQYAMMCRRIEQPSVIKDLVKLYVKERAIVFCQTKKEADDVSSNVLPKWSKALHGDITQQSRSRILEGFKSGAFKVLVTTDVAARGLDIPDVDLVIQAQPPQNTSYYIHRVGRTGRAGKVGMSILLYSRSEAADVQACEKTAKIKFEKMSIPTLEQLKQMCVEEAVSNIMKMSDDVSKYFEEAAEMLIKEKGAVSSLAAAMAIASNAENFSSRSLLTSAEGYTTLVYKKGNSTNYRTKDVVYDYMRGLSIRVQNFNVLADQTGAAFDVNTENVDAALESFNAIKQDPSESMTKVDVLPRIMEGRDFSSRSNSHMPGRYQSRGPRRNFRQNLYEDDDEDMEAFGSNYQSRGPRRNFRHDHYDDDNEDKEVFGSKFGRYNRKPSDQFRRNSGSSYGHYNRNNRDFDNDGYKPRSNHFRSNHKGGNFSNSKGSWINKDNISDDDF